MPSEKLQNYARINRNDPTTAERALWQILRKKKMGVRFHRQKPMCGFILDFWCPAAKLAVEADGRNHDTAYDARRDAILARHGVLTLRFRNREVFSDQTRVAAAIRETVAHRCGPALKQSANEKFYIFPNSEEII